MFSDDCMTVENSLKIEDKIIQFMFENYGHDLLSNTPK